MSTHETPLTAEMMARALRAAAASLEQDADRARLPPGYMLVETTITEYRVDGPHSFVGVKHVDRGDAISEAIAHHAGTTK